MKGWFQDDHDHCHLACRQRPVFGDVRQGSEAERREGRQMIDLYDALSPLLILGAFLFGRWTASRHQVRHREADLYERLPLSPEQAARDGGA